MVLLSMTLSPQILETWDFLVGTFFVVPDPASAYHGVCLECCECSHIFESVSHLALVSHGSLLGGDF